MLSYPGLYIITSPTEQRYIGIATKSFRQRFTSHKAQARHGKKTLIAEAFREFGDQMQCEVLAISDNVQYLQELEIRAIEAFGTLAPNGYNTSPGGGVTSKRSAEKISRALKGRVFTPEWRAKLGPNKRCVWAEGQVYPSRKAAADAFFLDRSQVKWRLKSSNFPNWLADGVDKVQLHDKRCRPKGSKDKSSEAWTNRSKARPKKVEF